MNTLKFILASAVPPLVSADYFGLPPLTECTPESMLPPGSTDGIELPPLGIINKPSEWQGYPIPKMDGHEVADIYQAYHHFRHELSGFII
jgi:hypothetical protein